MATAKDKFHSQYYWVISICGKVIVQEIEGGVFTFCGDDHKYTFEQIKSMFPVGRMEEIKEPSF